MKRRKRTKRIKMPILIGLIVLILAGGTALYASGLTGYLGDDPTTCNNCHVMNSAYDSWNQSDHKAWSNCNDCHTPHELIPKYFVKTSSGLRDLTALVLGNVHEPIHASQSTYEIIQANCIRCHTDVDSILPEGHDYSDKYCFECHGDAAHGVSDTSLSP